jgi:beta-ureidopropionase / N-carbamoyl-L-amino-acid hydrolase
VQGWLARLGLDASALECGAHPPLHAASAQRLAAAGRPPERVHNNCSGKHAGMITVARHLGAPIAVGAGIRPHGRWRFDLHGRPDHAGTTLLGDRDDPMLAQARLVLAAREVAEKAAWEDPSTVATVARVSVQPNSVNAIPSRVQAWLDVRAETEPTVRAVVERIAAEVGVAAAEESWTPRVDLDGELGRRVAAVLARRHGPSVPFLDTGAGHDAGILATAGIPSAMLYVRNPTGVSHAPEEHAERDDCLAGVIALADVLADLACR